MSDDDPFAVPAPEPVRTRKWTAAEAERQAHRKRLAAADLHQLTTRCGWCNTVWTGPLSETSVAFERHLREECPEAPREAHAVIVERRATRANKRERTPPLPPRDKTQPKKPRETSANRRTRARQLWDEGKNVDQVAAEVGVTRLVAANYLRLEGVRKPLSR